MTRFSLNWYGTEYPHEGLGASVFSDAIGGFKPEYDDYIILSPEEPIAHSVYLQTHSPDEDGLMPVEIRFEYGDGSFRHWGYETKDKQKILNIFLAYWGRGELPDLTGWEDISDQM